MRRQEKEPAGLGAQAAELMKKREAIAKLAASQDAKELMGMLQGMGSVQRAAQAAAGGDTGALMAMVEGLMQREEGARLAQRINEQAKQAGLSDG